jgi:hypothetical protein
MPAISCLQSTGLWLGLKFQNMVLAFQTAPQSPKLPRQYLPCPDAQEFGNPRAKYRGKPKSSHTSAISVAGTILEKAGFKNQTWSRYIFAESWFEPSQQKKSH